MKIYHLVRKSDWEKVVKSGVYSPPSLKEVGFIHCSTKDQVVETANRRYLGAKDLLLLVIDSSKVNTKIIHEDLKKMGEKHPHIYGKLSLTAVESVLRLVPGKNGKFSFPS